MELSDELKRIRQSRKSVEHTYKCPKCKDTHIIMTKDENGYTVAKDCECMAKCITERLMQSSGISQEDVNVKFNDFQTFNEPELIRARTIAFKYADSIRMQRFQKNNSLLLSGLPGRGKTMLGFAVSNWIIKNGVPVQYISYRDAITNLKQSIMDKDEYSESINRLKTVDVLFIDDLFKGKYTESDINIMYELINYRYLKRLPVIISTEKTQRQLLDVDEALGSRIIEMCKGFIVEFKESGNYRLRA